VVAASPSYTERLAKKYGTSPAQAQAMIERMVETAAAEGIAMDFEHIQPGNTFDAHRLLHWAAPRGAQDALKERLFRAYLCEGQPIGEPELLVRLASEVGLEPDEAAGVLATDAYASEVHADIAAARQLGINGVPFFVFAQRYGVSGAQNADSLLSVLQKVRAELGAGQIAAEGEVCGSEGCNTSGS
jgi:predicted DsbA family dithiol-disulfide isomerase